MATTAGGSRAERGIDKRDISEGAVLRDRVYDEEVKVVGVHVGQVYLRYPHQEKKHRYRCECGACRLGLDEIEEHVRDCEESSGDEWFDLVLAEPERAAEMDEDGEKGFERIEEDDFHVESYGYDWPLDGNRFTVVEE